MGQDDAWWCFYHLVLASLSIFTILMRKQCILIATSMLFDDDDSSYVMVVVIRVPGIIRCSACYVMRCKT